MQAVHFILPLMLFALSLQLRALWLGLQGSRNKTQLPPAGGKGGAQQDWLPVSQISSFKALFPSFSQCH